MDGNLEAWDLLQQQSEPIMTIKVRFNFAFNWLRRDDVDKMMKLCKVILDNFSFSTPSVDAHDVDEKCFPFS